MAKGQGCSEGLGREPVEGHDPKQHGLLSLHGILLCDDLDPPPSTLLMQGTHEQRVGDGFPRGSRRGRRHLRQLAPGDADSAAMDD